jgi:catechol 2,3-dioxygenase-like lactoylglutathione lyase family enzyme
MTNFRLEGMQLLGVVVNDLDAAVARYGELFGLDFVVFTAGVDYEVTSRPTGVRDPHPLAANSRIALDTSGTLELIEIPGADEGFRNIHFRVTDAKAAVAVLEGRGLRVVRDMRIGLAREVIFDSLELNGIRLCLLEYDGNSLAEALAASPRP